MTENKVKTVGGNTVEVVAGEPPETYHVPENDAKSFARITELISEMVWGIDLPPVMTVEYNDPILGDPRRLSVDPKTYKPVFEAIAQKLVSASTYEPFITLKLDNDRLRSQLRSKDIIAQKNSELNYALREVKEYSKEKAERIREMERNLSDLVDSISDLTDDPGLKFSVWFQRMVSKITWCTG